MDKRLKLTDKQKELVKDLEKAFEALEKEHVGIIFDMSYGGIFRIFNTAESLGFDMSDVYSTDQDEYFGEPNGNYLEEAEKGYIWYSPKQDDLETLSPIIYMVDWFAVKLKENEDSDAFFRGKKIEELKQEVKKNQKKLKRHLNNIEQAESNISIFKEKGLPRDLIDEEQVSILSNQEAVEKYQKVIEDLESEIQKLKEA